MSRLLDSISERGGCTWPLWVLSIAKSPGTYVIWLAVGRDPNRETPDPSMAIRTGGSAQERGSHGGPTRACSILTPPGSVRQANTLCDQGKFEEAAKAFQDARDIDSAQLGADHPDTAMDVGSLGMVLAVQHKWREVSGLIGIG